MVESLLVLPVAPVAQLDRASGYEPEGRTFESCRAHHKHQIVRRVRRSGPVTV
jgi:hypothetical protein